MLLLPLSNAAMAAPKWIGLSLVLLVTISITTTGGSLQHSRDENPTNLGAKGRHGTVYSHDLTTGNPNLPQSNSERKPQGDSTETQKEVFSAQLPRDSSTQGSTETENTVMKDRRDFLPHIPIRIEDQTSGTVPQYSRRQNPTSTSPTLKNGLTTNVVKELDKISPEETNLPLTSNDHRDQEKQSGYSVNPTSLSPRDNFEMTVDSTTTESMNSTIPDTFQGTSDNSRTPGSNTPIHRQHYTSSPTSSGDKTTETGFTDSEGRTSSYRTENNVSTDVMIGYHQSTEEYPKTPSDLESVRHSSLMSLNSSEYAHHWSTDTQDVTLLNSTNVSSQIPQSSRVESAGQATRADMDWPVNESLTTSTTSATLDSRTFKGHFTGLPRADYSNPENDSSLRETSTSYSFATTDRTQTSYVNDDIMTYDNTTYDNTTSVINVTSTEPSSDNAGISEEWAILSASPDTGVSSTVAPSSQSAPPRPSSSAISSPTHHKPSMTQDKHQSSSRPPPTATRERLPMSQSPTRPSPSPLIPDRFLPLRWIISPRRVVIPEGEAVDITWECPPSSDEVSASPEGYHYDWYKISSDARSYRNPLSSSIDPISRKSVLRMQSAGTAQQGRYFCTGRGVSLFNASSGRMDIHVYQLVVLRSRWVNIGSVDSVTLYRGQRAVINCPFGDIVRDNVTLDRGRLCSGRMSVRESLTKREAGWQHFRCTDSDKITVKTPPEDSSSNCALSLLGCSMNGQRSRPRCAASDSESDAFQHDTPGLLHLDKCRFKLVTVRNATGPSRADRCSQNGTLVFLRYYFDTTKGKCFPLETRSCGDDSNSFSTLRDCQQTCVSISADLKRCFLPTNEDQSRPCSMMSLRGAYRATYDLESHTCRWFYHCGPIGSLSANIFSSIRQCNETCVRNQPRIIAESIKACNYFDEEANQTPIGNNSSIKLGSRWIFNRRQGRCQLQGHVPARSTGGGRFQFRMSSRKSCERTCRVFGSQEICKSRPENGVCSKKRLRWHFNWEDGRCIQILDGGCGHSLNRFPSRQICEQICSRLVHTAATKPTVTSTVPTSSTSRLTSTNTHITTRRFLVSSPARASRKGSLDRSLKSRRRVHRRVPDLMHKPEQVGQRKTLKSRRNLKASKSQSKLLDRKLDFDPCLKDAFRGVCDYGFGRTTYEMKRYSFDVQTGRCQIVKFSGCLAGQNLFDDANDCRAACEYRLRPALKSPRCQNPYSERCVTPDQTHKTKRLVRYFFFSMTGECIRFSAVDRRKCLGQFFESKEHCLQVCSPRPPMERMLQNRCFGKYVLSESSCSAELKVDLWFFFSDINQCLQYSTCPVDIDGNVFLTRVECEQACRASNIMTVCELPVDPGQGIQNTVRYYHDSQQKRCRLFYYKGSFGNLNRFTTKKECSRACPGGDSRDSLKFRPPHLTSLGLPKDNLFPQSEEAWLNEIADTEYCYDQHRYGACSSTDQLMFVKKYYYDAYRKQCEPYMFSGCGALSRNSFDSLDTCDRMCTERVSRTASSLCSPKVSRCPDSSWIYWIYNLERGLCEPFPSCIKRSDDQFFFTNETHCSEVCVPRLPLQRHHFDICHLTIASETNCSEPTTRWSYDRVSDSCRPSISCEYYGNNFPSKEACLSACDASSLLDVCRLPVDKGPCHNNSTVSFFYFDWTSQICKPFAYGGCIGNRNRFQSYTECNMMCSVHNPCNPNTHNIGNCQAVKKTGSRPFFYNTTSNKCQLWTESVCGDPSQLFSTLPDCVQRCVVLSDVRLLAYEEQRTHHTRCFEKLKFDSYPLCVGEWLPRFFYDQDHDQCQFFYYNGCQGPEDMGNRFSSMIQCIKHCGRETKTMTKIEQRRLSTLRPISTDSLLISAANIVVAKHELCPSFSHPCQDLRERFVKCQIDSDCKGSEKCCSCEMDQSIVSSCMEPIGCIATEYGCCLDGVTVASDELHNTCPSQLVEIDPSLPERVKKEAAEDLVLNCYVTGDPKPNITWVYHGTIRKSFPVDSKWDLIRPLWSGSLRVPASDSPYGLWSCQATNKAGWDEKELYVHDSELQEGFLEVHTPDGRDNLTLNATRHSNVTLHCPIYGVPRPTITWSFNKVSVVNGTLLQVSIYHRIINIVNVDSLHEGHWSCRASNSKIKSLSFVIHLKVMNLSRGVAPQIGTDIKAWFGQTIILFCNVQTELTDRPHRRPRVLWFWEAGNRSLAIRSGLRNDSKILIVPHFQVGYTSGRYVCRSSDGISTQEVKYKIVPYTFNEISTDPAGVMFTGITVTLRCPAGMLQGGSLAMRRDTLWTKGHAFYRETKTNELELTLRSKRDSGLYSCKYNDGGDKEFSTYLLVNDDVLTI